MEHTLRAIKVMITIHDARVLILVLVEHTLRGCRSQGWSHEPLVLILVLVEHTLREFLKAMHSQRCSEHTLRGPRKPLMTQMKSLNPCFSGTYSQRAIEADGSLAADCLNPCFSGTYSQSLLCN